MNDLVTGIIHVHSDFSRDGLCSIADLADFAREAGFQFVGLTDHREDLSYGDLKSLRAECETVSDESFAMIPGLEFRCDGDIHILALGIADDIASTDAVTVASQIEARGGLAILAHPGRNGYQCPLALCGVLNGIEIWNAAYDGRFVPRLATFRLLQEARSANPAIFGFGGADLHSLDRSPGVILELQLNGKNAVDAWKILQSLRTGMFAVHGRCVSFDAYAMPRPLACLRLWALRKLYEVSKAIRDVGMDRS